MSPLRLYVDSQFTSPYAMSVFVALHEKGMDFQMITVDLAASENQAGAYVLLPLNVAFGGRAAGAVGIKPAFKGGLPLTFV